MHAHEAPLEGKYPDELNALEEGEDDIVMQKYRCVCLKSLRSSPMSISEIEASVNSSWLSWPQSKIRNVYKQWFPLQKPHYSRKVIEAF